MKKLLGILVLGLLLGGCAGPQDGVLSSVLYFVSIILVTLVLGPSVYLMGKLMRQKIRMLALYYG
jgi:hypothetical protein